MPDPSVAQERKRSEAREKAVEKYGECLKAVAVLRCIPTIDCDKLTKEVFYDLIRRAGEISKVKYEDTDV